MAKANTYAMERGGFSWDRRGCCLCGKKPEYRGFFYPTFMNGDAEWLGDFCKEHSNPNLLSKIGKEIKTIHPIIDN